MTEDFGVKLENVKIEDLGQAKKMTIDKDNTTMWRRRQRKSIAGRVKQLRTQVEDTRRIRPGSFRSDWPSWSAGVAISRSARRRKPRLKEKKARVEDAMHATKAAVEEGIVPGGGDALLRASKALQNLEVVGDEQMA